jgi:muramoyltetrapeptide carboxypeptidase LdcA involved in peptidoglycan recycling
LEVIQWILTAGRFPADAGVLDGAVLLLEASEDLTPAAEIGYIVRSLGERGLLAAVDAVVVSRPPTSTLELVPGSEHRAAHRAEQRDVVLGLLQRYNPEAVVVVGVSFGHTRPHWILPYGGTVTVDGVQRRIWADYT